MSSSPTSTTTRAGSSTSTAKDDTAPRRVPRVVAVVPNADPTVDLPTVDLPTVDPPTVDPPTVVRARDTRDPASTPS